MKGFTRLALATLNLTVCVFCCACSKEDPNPEVRDPIYADLAKRQSDAEKAADESKAKISELMESREKAEPNSTQKRDIERDLVKLRAQNLDAGQLARYYKIRTERRRLVDKLAYKEALGAKKEWPDPKEYSDYLTNHRLLEVNRNWNARVPKLQERLSTTGKPAGENPKTEAKKEE